jgi:hypothetical protein
MPLLQNLGKHAKPAKLRVPEGKVGFEKDLENTLRLAGSNSIWICQEGLFFLVSPTFRAQF